MNFRPKCKLCGHEHFNAEPHNWKAAAPAEAGVTKFSRAAFAKAPAIKVTHPKPNKVTLGRKAKPKRGRKSKDAAIAKKSLAKIAADPSILITGKELEDRLARMDRETENPKGGEANNGAEVTLAQSPDKMPPHAEQSATHGAKPPGRGRPKQFTSSADKQKAYRARAKNPVG